MANKNIKEEAKNIAEKYQKKTDEVSKIEQLRKLDESTTKIPNIIALTLGIIGILIFGIGMCCWLVWSEYKILGTILCVVGFGIALANVPMHKKIVNARKAELAPQIIQLSRDIMNEE